MAKRKTVHKNKSRAERLQKHLASF